MIVLCTQNVHGNFCVCVLHKQRERDRHQEAMADLRDNNRELGEQLQEAQDELERLLAARAKEQQSPRQRRVSDPTLQDLQSALALARLVETPDEKFYSEHHEREFSTESWQLLLQAREDFARGEAKRNSQYQSQLQQEAAKEEQFRLLLQEARQQLNNLKNENAELKLSVGKMRYNVDSLVGEPVAPPPPLAETEKRASGLVEEPVPPPPDPLPPPPLAETAEQASEKKVGLGDVKIFQHLCRFLLDPNCSIYNLQFIFYSFGAQWLERLTCRGKVVGLNPCRNGRGEFSSLGPTFCADSLFWDPFHLHVTTVACKRPQSTCQKCRWQITAKYTCTFA